MSSLDLVVAVAKRPVLRGAVLLFGAISHHELGYLSGVVSDRQARQADTWYHSGSEDTTSWSRQSLRQCHWGVSPAFIMR